MAHKFFRSSGCDMFELGLGGQCLMFPHTPLKQELWPKYTQDSLNDNDNIYILSCATSLEDTAAADGYVHYVIF